MGSLVGRRICYSRFRMNTENLRLEKHGSIATVTLDRPKVLNALNAATFAELDSVFDELAGDREVRVVLLTGAGERAFAAGADIRELAAERGREGKAFSLRGQAVFRKIETLGKPVIACVRGFALGGGLRAGDGLHPAHCSRRCEVRTARGEARSHSGDMVGRSVCRGW